MSLSMLVATSVDAEQKFGSVIVAKLQHYRLLDGLRWLAAQPSYLEPFLCAIVCSERQVSRPSR